MQSNEDKALSDLGSVWNMLAPAADQDFTWRLVDEMKADGTTDKRQQCRAIVGRIYDGLAYGNWPST